MNREHEHSRLALEAQNAGCVLHRLMNFARILDQSPPPAWSVESIDDLATQLQDWAVAVSSDPSRVVADDLAVRSRRERVWQERQPEIAQDRRASRGGVPPSRPC